MDSHLVFRGDLFIQRRECVVLQSAGTFVCIALSVVLMSLQHQKRKQSVELCTMSPTNLIDVAPYTEVFLSLQFTL